jgi:hypothetical protein
MPARMDMAVSDKRCSLPRRGLNAAVISIEQVFVNLLPEPTRVKHLSGVPL